MEKEILRHATLKDDLSTKLQKDILSCKRKRLAVA